MHTARELDCFEGPPKSRKQPAPIDKHRLGASERAQITHIVVARARHSAKQAALTRVALCLHHTIALVCMLSLLQL